jgi:tetratricopeptide repeat protein 21B
MMGKAKLFELRKNLPAALEVVTEVFIKFSWYMPALIEKTRMLLALSDWDQVCCGWVGGWVWVWM